MVCVLGSCVLGSSAPKLAGRRWFEVRVAGVHAPVMRGPRNDWEVPQARTRYTAFQPSNPPKSRDTGLNRARALHALAHGTGTHMRSMRDHVLRATIRGASYVCIDDEQVRVLLA